MSEHNLMSVLQFGYAPMSSYEFDMLRNDKDVQRALSKCVLYIIAKRPLIRFDEWSIDNNDRTLNFKLYRSDVQYKLECKFYIDSLSDLRNRELDILSGSFTSDKTKIYGFKIFDVATEEFLLWCNAEKFLYLFSHDYIDAKIKGDIFDFLTFDVLYVGKCTDESIFKRFKSHHALQEILIQEQVITPDYNNSHEFVILPFEFWDNSFVKTYDGGNIDELPDDQIKIGQIDSRTIALDEEKALINCLNPKYNKEKFKSYPKSKDGLYEYNLGKISYCIGENIRLRYKTGSILGNVNYFDSSVSFIGIEKDTAEIFNAEINL